MNDLQAQRRVALSYPLSPSAPVAEGGIAMVITPTSRQSNGDLSDTSTVRFWNHAGTHVDGPAHMLPNCGPLTQYLPLTGAIYEFPLVVDIPCIDDTLIDDNALRPLLPFSSQCDLLLLRTFFSRYRSVAMERYRQHNPGLAQSAAQLILERCPQVKCIGIDSISIAAMAHLSEGIAAHKLAFGRNPPVLLLEDLNLEWGTGRLLEVTMAPLFIEGLDSCPCTVIGVVEDAR